MKNIGKHYIQDCINITANAGHKFEASQAERQLDKLQRLPEWLEKIDWKQLKEQKAILVNVVNSDEFGKIITEPLIGIIHLLDAMQDYAVNHMGVDENEVFDLEE